MSNDGEVNGLRAQIAELERTLEEEKRSRALLQLETELAKLAADQEASRYKSDCLVLRHKAASLEQERNALRERGLRDQAWVKGLLEELAALERAKTLAQDEAREWTRKFAQVEAQARRFFDENQKAAGEVGRLKEKNAELEARSSRLAGSIEGFKERSVEMEKKSRDLGQAATTIESVRGWMKKHAATPASGNENSVGKDSGGDSDDETPLVQRRKKLKEAAAGSSIHPADFKAPPSSPFAFLRTPAPPASGARQRSVK